MSKGKPTFNIKKVNDIKTSDYPVGKIMIEDIVEPDGYIYSLEYLRSIKIEKGIEKEVEDYFDDIDEESYEVCSEFGCGKKLRLEETLAGSRCNKHSK